MRKRFQPQIQLGTVPINEINFNLFSRHEITPILFALQYLYLHCEKKLNKILELIEKDIRRGKNKSKGATGMTCWEILILTALRLGCNYNFDQLADIASYHILVRQMLQISQWVNKIFSRSTIHDNYSLLSPATIRMISDIIVSIGHEIEPEALKKVRGDTFVSRKNIHHPTDSNLLGDGIRKIIELSYKIATFHSISGWEEIQYLMRKLKKLQRTIGIVARSRAAKRDEKLKAYYADLMAMASQMIEKATGTIRELAVIINGELPRYWEKYVSELHYFIAGTEYVCEQARRRIINGESVPNPDKVFSLFEPDTELINRGKTPYPIEFGHRVLIIQDAAGFIIHQSVLGQGFTDEKIIADVMRKLQTNYNEAIKAASFDKGFWTPNNLKDLSEFIPLVVLPKKGKLSDADQLREGSDEFGDVRKWHPGIESAIHALVAANGLKVCRDKGSTGYKKYIATAILGRNLHTLGSILMKNLKKKLSEENLLMNLIR